MPEHDCLPPDVTATEFVAHMGRMSGLPPSPAKERAADTLRHVGLHEERYRQIGTYSTGMNQRVKLAQALVARSRAAHARRADQRSRPGRPRRRCWTDQPDRRPTSASRCWSPRTCSASSSRSATTWWRRGGRLIRSDSIRSFTQIQPGAAGGGDSDTAELAERCARWRHPRASGRGLLDPCGHDDDLRRGPGHRGRSGPAAARLEQRRHRLEEIFRDEPLPERPATHVPETGPEVSHVG